MPLWVGLQLAIPHAARADQKVMRAVELEAIRDYPGKVGDCKCKMCRYHRISKMR